MRAPGPPAAEPDFETADMRGVLQTSQGVGDRKWATGGPILAHLPNVSSTLQTIQNLGGTTILPTAAGTVTISSTSVEDAPGGMGIAAVLVRGLDANYDNGGPPVPLTVPWLFEVVALDGTNTVSAGLVIPFLRCLQILGVASGGGPGATRRAVGGITASIAGNPQVHILPGESTSRSSHFVTPRRFNAFGKRIVVRWSGNQAANVICNASIFGTGIDTDLLQQRFETSGTTDAGTVALPPRTDFFCTAEIPVGGTDPLDIVLPVDLRLLVP